MKQYSNGLAFAAVVPANVRRVLLVALISFGLVSAAGSATIAMKNDAGACAEARAVGDFAEWDDKGSGGAEIQARAALVRAGHGIGFVYVDQRARRFIQLLPAATRSDHQALGVPFGARQRSIDSSVFPEFRARSLPSTYSLSACR